MKKIVTEVYQTSDGKVFNDLKEAEKHESEIKNVKAFRVYAHPDLTEGRHGPKFQGYLLIHANGCHDMFAEEWGYKKYKNKIDFVMGAYGSNAIMTKWNINPCKIEDVEQDKIIDKIEEQFVTKIWS